MAEKIKKSELLDMVKDTVEAGNKKLNDRLDDIESRQPKLVGDSNANETKTEETKKPKFPTFKTKKAGEVPFDEFSFVRFLRAKESGNWKEAE